MAAETPAEVRRARLRAMLAQDGFVRVAAAAAELGVSEVTLRADLAALERAGALTRIHGGAMPVARGREDPVEATDAREREAKRAIGRAAAALVPSGACLALDVGSTALAVARALVARPELHDVTILTNGLGIALALEEAVPRFTVLVTGGTLRPLQHSLVAPLADATLAGVHLDLAILGGNGVAEDGDVTNLNLPEAEVKRVLLDRADRAVLIADGSKAGRTAPARIGALREFATLVTAGRGGGRLAALARAHGVAAIVADGVTPDGGDDAPRLSG